MHGFAVVNMAGNLTVDPVVRWSTSGIPVASFSVATTRVFKGEFNEHKWTSYIDCVVNGDDAEETAKKFKKGAAVEISGKLLQQRWEVRGGYKKSRVVVEVVAMYPAFAMATVETSGA